MYPYEFLVNDLINGDLFRTSAEAIVKINESCNNYL